MYNYYQQQPSAVMPQQRIATPPIPQFSGLKGHPVSSLEEVKATSIDFDGSTPEEKQVLSNKLAQLSTKVMK